MSLRRSIYKSPAQMRLMIAPGLATAASLDAARAAIRVGATTLELVSAA
jgi:methionyl aminopeptidase